MLNRLEIIEERYNNIQEMLQDGEVVRDVKKMTALMKEMRSLEKIVERYHEYKSIRDSLDELKLLAADSDPEISEMAKMELDEAQTRYPVLEEELKISKGSLCKIDVNKPSAEKMQKISLNPSGMLS